MQAKTDNLKKYFSDMNEKEFGRLITDRFDKLESKIESDRWIELNNGTKRKLLTKEAVCEIYGDTKKIKQKMEYIEQDTTILRDFSSLHKLAKKYNLYWITLFLISSAFIREIILMVIGK